MIWIIYNIIFTVVFVAMLPKFLLHMRRRGGYWKNFWQRLAVYSPELKDDLQKEKWFWVHGVSVGEVFVALRFMKAYRQRYPDTRFVLSVTTSTGHKVALERLSDRDAVIYFPVDTPVIMRRVLNLIDPLGLALIETELWPNLIRIAASRDIPVYLVNGRMSDSSYKGYRHLKLFTAKLMPSFRKIFVQSDLDRSRFLDIGALPEQVEVAGTAKYDTAQRDSKAQDKGRQILDQAGFAGDKKLLLGASTWPGEEEVLLDIYTSLRKTDPNLRLILAPRHAERRQEVLQVIRSRNIGVASRQDIIAGNGTPPQQSDVFLLDTTGELGYLYPHVDLVFVGKSLGKNHGGQNPLEAAVYGRAIVVGPNMENFRIVIRDLLEYDAVQQVEDADGLESTIVSLLQDEDRCCNLGRRAEDAVESKRGAIESTVRQILGQGG